MIELYSKESDQDAEEEGEVTEPHPLVSVTNINPEDIPEVPENKFLMRGGRVDNKKESNRKDEKRG